MMRQVSYIIGYYMVTYKGMDKSTIASKRAKISPTS